jgi:hypothetical protein
MKTSGYEKFSLRERPLPPLAGRSGCPLTRLKDHLGLNRAVSGNFWGIDHAND